MFLGSLFAFLQLTSFSQPHPPSKDQSVLSDGRERGKQVFPYAMVKEEVPLAVEAYPDIPSELQLQQVHIYVRHGASCACVPTWLLTVAYRRKNSSRCEDVGASRVDTRILVCLQLHAISLGNSRTVRPLCTEGRRFRASVASLLVPEGGLAKAVVQSLELRRSLERPDGTFNDADWYVASLLRWSRAD
jgi:hypothetical protein